MKLKTFLCTAVIFVVGLSTAAPSQTEASSSQGKEIFARKCVTCHGSDGAGSAVGKSLKVADLRSALVQKKSDADLTQVISKGKNSMPPFGNDLSADEIKALVAYVRTLKMKKK